MNISRKPAGTQRWNVWFEPVNIPALPWYIMNQSQTKKLLRTCSWLCMLGSSVKGYRKNIFKISFWKHVYGVGVVSKNNVEEDWRRNRVCMHYLCKKSGGALRWAYEFSILHITASGDPWAIRHTSRKSPSLGKNIPFFLPSTSRRRVEEAILDDATMVNSWVGQFILYLIVFS